MKTGDLVRHRKDGDLGIILDTRDSVTFRYWVCVAWISSGYAGADDWYNPFILEVISGSR